MSKTRTERQIEAFVRWVNDVISCRGLEIESFPEDLKNGVIMCHLAEILTNEKLRKFNPHPTLQAHEIDNLSVAFKLLKKSSLRLVNVGPQDVHNGYVKCILGLLWSCVQTYQLETVNKPSSIDNKSQKTEQVISPEQTCMSHFYFIAYHAKLIKKKKKLHAPFNI